jgi:hypothetical protein
MPLRLNVGASQKVSDERYGSRGASVNLEIELDSALAMEPAKLQERVRQLFSMVRQSVSEELAKRNGKADTRASSEESSVPTTKKPTNTPRPATSRQVKALHAIAKQQGFDLLEVVRDRYGLDRPEAFTIQQASELITALKSGEQSSAA